mmetsp:Transcript_30034/g.96399  ORF Transcript_30034/g.96399 Transcript_30034/m.96399 type:complete len:362 (-) Transcript_30034:641-1726(-)
MVASDERLGAGGEPAGDGDVVVLPLTGGEADSDSLGGEGRDKAFAVLVLQVLLHARGDIVVHGTVRVVDQLDHPRHLRPHHQRPEVNRLWLERHGSYRPNPVHVEMDRLLGGDAPPLLPRGERLIKVLRLPHLRIRQVPHLGLVDLDGNLEAVRSLPSRREVNKQADLLVATEDSAVRLDHEDAGAALRHKAGEEDGNPRRVLHLDRSRGHGPDAGGLHLEVIRLQLDRRRVAAPDERQLHCMHGAPVHDARRHVLVPLRLQRAEHERDELRAMRHDQPVVGLAAKDASLVLVEEVSQRRVRIVVHLDDLVRLVAHSACWEADPRARHPQLRRERFHADRKRVAAADGGNAVRRDEVLVRD